MCRPQTRVAVNEARHESEASRADIELYKQTPRARGPEVRMPSEVAFRFVCFCRCFCWTRASAGHCFRHISLRASVDGRVLLPDGACCCSGNSCLLASAYGRSIGSWASLKAHCVTSAVRSTFLRALFRSTSETTVIVQVTHEKSSGRRTVGN